ncbi:hypothetical protein [uncultured Winogradskyella sp.]|uniref:hypothetical protein n=1 Tax=uncultured Winogradskyella sp. TaxID=395353 RepID=UPI003511A350
MKKFCAILVFLTVSALSFGQSTTATIEGNEDEKQTKLEQPMAKKSKLSSEIKARVLKINRKKSNDIISIKAYRKSLQIKVKTVKLC